MLVRGLSLYVPQHRFDGPGAILLLVEMSWQGIPMARSRTSRNIEIGVVMGWEERMMTLDT